MKKNKLFKYSIKVNKDDLKYIKGKKYLLREENGIITFFTNKYELNDNIEIEVENLYSKMIKCFLKKNTINIICFLMMFLIIYFLSKIILKIEFSNNEYYSIEVYDYVNSKVKYVNKIGLLKEDISIINKDLRNKFYQYQWIDIEKKGTSIFINISKTTDDKIEVESDKVGSLYSRYDAYILGYYCKSGNILIQNNSFVQKDEELISGVIPKYNTNGEFVRASGYVIGEVTTFENIKIKKKIDERIRSGNITRYKQISFLKQKSNSPYEEYEMEKRVLFKIGNLILLEEITYYELISNTITYNENDALIYGKSMIYNNFISNKKYDFEKIFSIKELNIKEDNSYFYLSYKVNKKIDICYFSDIKINEINDIE